MSTGELWQWQQDDEWIAVHGLTDNHILVKYGDLYWINIDGVLIDTVISDKIDEKLRTGKYLKMVSRNEYKDAVRDRKIANCPHDAPIIKTENVTVPEHLAPLVKMGVRFF